MAYGSLPSPAIVHCRMAKAASPRKNLGMSQMPIPLDHRQQHLPPVFGARLVAASQHRVLQIAELVEQKQRMVAEALEVAVVGRALLPAVGLADGTVHVERSILERLVPMDLVDPLAAKASSAPSGCALAEYLGLEAAHDAHGSGFVVRLRCPPAHHMAHGRIDGQPLGVIHIFVACQSAVDRLSQQRHEQVLLVACPGVNRSAASAPISVSPSASSSSR